MDENTDLSVLTFPDKLWYMVNEPKYTQIQWNSDGTSIIIPNNHEFIAKVLNNPAKVLFKTKHFASFVRQLNLYGFRKVSEQRKVGQSQPVSTNKSEFKHPSFIKGRKDLLEEVKRQPSLNKKEESPCEEKPRPTNNNIQVQQYAPLSSPPMGGMWTNWDPFLCPFTWMPYTGGVQGSYAMPSPPPFESQWFYGKDGLPCFVPYGPPISNSTPYAYDEVYVNGKRNDLNANGSPVSKITVALPVPLQSTSSLVFNSSLPTHYAVSTGNNFQDNGDVNKTDEHHSPPSYCVVDEAAKKPLPAQTSEVSTTSNTGNTNITEWKMSGHTAIRITDKVTKTEDDKMSTGSHNCKKLQCMK